MQRRFFPKVMSTQPPTEQEQQAKEPELTDEQILEFEQRIKDEEALKVNLVSPAKLAKRPLTCLLHRSPLYAKPNPFPHSNKNSRTTNRSFARSRYMTHVL